MVPSRSGCHGCWIMSSSIGGHGKNEWGELRSRPWFGVATFLQSLTLLRYHVNCVVQLIMARHIS